MIAPPPGQRRADGPCPHADCRRRRRQRCRAPLPSSAGIGSPLGRSCRRHGSRWKARPTRATGPLPDPGRGELGPRPRRRLSECARRHAGSLAPDGTDQWRARARNPGRSSDRLARLRPICARACSVLVRTRSASRRSSVTARIARSRRPMNSGPASTVPAPSSTSARRVRRNCACGSIDDLPAIGTDENGQTTIRIVAPGAFERCGANMIFAVSQATALRGRYGQAVVQVSERAPGRARPGTLTVVLATTAELPDLPDAGSRGGQGTQLRRLRVGRPPRPVDSAGHRRELAGHRERRRNPAHGARLAADQCQPTAHGHVELASAERALPVRGPRLALFRARHREPGILRPPAAHAPSSPFPAISTQMPMARRRSISMQPMRPMCCPETAISRSSSTAMSRRQCPSTRPPAGCSSSFRSPCRCGISDRGSTRSGSRR